MGDLSKNFSAWEFRCPCGCGFDGVDPLLVQSLQELRDIIKRPIRINSGCRCPRHNQDVGGEIDSQHLLGKAADVVVSGVDPGTIARIAERIPAFKQGGIGIYNTFTHLDVRDNGPARWDRRKEES